MDDTLEYVRDPEGHASMSVDVQKRVLRYVRSDASFDGLATRVGT